MNAKQEALRHLKRSKAILEKSPHHWTGADVMALYESASTCDVREQIGQILAAKDAIELLEAMRTETEFAIAAFENTPDDGPGFRILSVVRE